ncbi:hypothetical protein AHAS_Ahas10G0103700 [Arachis hypogaea]
MMLSYSAFQKSMASWLVSNGQEELLHWYAANAKNNLKILHALERCAAMIIQAIGHFKLGTNISPRDVSDLTKDIENAHLAHEVVNFNLLLEKWRR